MSFQTVILEKVDHVATLTLNRPERLNALNDLMFEELLAALDDIEHDDDVRVMLLTGAGRAFCASADPDGRQGRSWANSMERSVLSPAAEATSEGASREPL